MDEELPGDICDHCGHLRGEHGRQEFCGFALPYACFKCECYGFEDDCSCDADSNGERR